MINSQSRNLYIHGKTFPGSKPDNDEKRPNGTRSTINTRQTIYAKLVRNAKSAHNTKLTYNAKLAHNAKSIHNIKLTYNAKVAHDAWSIHSIKLTNNAKLAHNSKLTYNATLIHNAKLAYNVKLTNKAKLAYNVKPTHNAKSTNEATLFNGANAGSDEIPIKGIRQVYGTQYVHTYGDLHIQDTSKTCPPLSCQSRPSQSYLYLSYHNRPVIFAILRGTPNSNKQILASSMFTRAGALTRASTFTKTNLAILPSR